MLLSIPRERKGERQEDTDVRDVEQLPPAPTPTGTGTRSLNVCPDWEWNPEPPGAQTALQLMEPPGQSWSEILKI